MASKKPYLTKELQTTTYAYVGRVIFALPNIFQSDPSTNVIYKIGGGVPINPIFSSGLTINSGFTYTNGTEQSGYTLFTDGTGYAYWDSGPTQGVTGITATDGLSSQTTSNVTTIINIDKGSSQNIFKSILVDNTVQFSANSNSDSLNFSGINLTITSAGTNTLVFSAGTGGGGSGGTTDFSAVSINSVTQFTSLSDKTINFSGINVSITSAATNTLVFSAGTGGSLIGDYLPLSGGTVTGDTIFTSGLTATTISATTYDNLPVSAITAGSNIVVSNTNGNVTISQNNAGTNVLWKDVTLYTSNVAANTILASKLIPANTFEVGDFYEYTINFSGNTPNGTAVTRRVYINTSASLVGAQQLAIFANSVGTNQYTALYRHGFVISTGTTGSFNSFGQATAISSILFNNSATQIFTINTTIDQYFIVATQVASTSYIDGFRGINLRITR
jgi:hypothetical protein